MALNILTSFRRPHCLSQVDNPYVSLLPPLELDGFLTGVVITPHPMPNNWALKIWAQGEPHLDKANEQRALDYAASQVRSISMALLDVDQYLPKCMPNRQIVDKDRIREWIWGLYTAMQCAPEYWNSIARDPGCAVIIEIFEYFANLLSPPSNKTDQLLMLEYASLLPMAIAGLNLVARSCEEALPPNVSTSLQ